MSYTVHRYIAIYDVASDELVETVSISNSEFEQVRTMLGYDSHDPMYYCYPLKGDVLRGVFALLGDRLMEGSYEYHLEAESV